MNESVVDAAVLGLIVGVVLGPIGFVANMVWKLIRFRSEGARRFQTGKWYYACANGRQCCLGTLNQGCGFEIH